MADEHNGLARVFTGNAIQGRSYAQHKLYPVLRARGNRPTRVLLVVRLSIDLPKHLHWHTFSCAWAHFLNGVIECQRDAKRGSNDLCRLSCTRECAGDEVIGRNLLTG